MCCVRVVEVVEVGTVICARVDVDQLEGVSTQSSQATAVCVCVCSCNQSTVCPSVKLP